MGDRVERRAYAKVNLGLDIIGRRKDGYHLVRMVMQQIGLYDVLTFEKTAEPGVRLQLAEGCTIPDIDEMPLDDRNLIVRAAKAVLEKYDIRCGMTITLEKHIPMAAGMAGGSTDCAAALTGAAELFGIGTTPEELAELGVRLGADVPYCLMGGTALAEGIGEKLTRLPDLPDCRFIIVKPSFGVSTKEVYTAYDALAEEQSPADEKSSAVVTGGTAAERRILHPDIDGMEAALKAGDLVGVTDRLGNVLEPVTVARHPEIARIEERLKAMGITATIMTGSGPTVFGILPGAAEDTEDGESGLRPDISALQEQLAKDGISAMIFLVGTR